METEKITTKPAAATTHNFGTLTGLRTVKRAHDGQWEAHIDISKTHSRCQVGASEDEAKAKLSAILLQEGWIQ